jgi:mono/diheme cytochrome c family protein
MRIGGYAALAAIAASTAWAATAANAPKPATGDAGAGKRLALLACTGCHIAAPDQPFKPVYSGPPRPPDFKDIANKPDVTAESLRRHLETLPAVPQNSRMPNPMLSTEELRNVAAFIISLGDKPAAPTQ